MTRISNENKYGLRCAAFMGAVILLSACGKGMVSSGMGGSGVSSAELDAAREAERQVPMTKIEEHTVQTEAAVQEAQKTLDDLTAGGFTSLPSGLDALSGGVGVSSLTGLPERLEAGLN